MISFIKEFWEFLKREKNTGYFYINCFSFIRSLDRFNPRFRSCTFHLYNILMTKILGISAFFHDSAAALIEDGVIIAAAQEEDLQRKKHDPSYPLMPLSMY